METKDEVFEMNDGCICCTVRGDLLRIFAKLRKRATKFDHILIETTGLADPAPVAQTFFVDEQVRLNYELDAIITVVDSKHVIPHLDEERPEGMENEAVEQVCASNCGSPFFTSVVSCVHFVSSFAIFQDQPTSLSLLSMAQIAFADKILLNKIDLVTETEKAAVFEKIRSVKFVFL